MRQHLHGFCINSYRKQVYKAFLAIRQVKMHFLCKQAYDFRKAQAALS